MNEEAFYADLLCKAVISFLLTFGSPLLLIHD
jgi:hypothetical protein